MTSIYVGAAAVALLSLAIALFSDLAHEETIARDVLALETEVRAHYLSRHLELLGSELGRLGLRSEVNLRDENLEPEQSLLRLSHENSTFFNVGVAILDPEGTVQWSEPREFLRSGASLARAPILGAVRQSRAVQVMPADGRIGQASVLYVASPVLREGQLTAVLIGAIDLASTLLTGSKVAVALATREGRVVFPAGFPLQTPLETVPAALLQPAAAEGRVDGRAVVVAGTPVHGTDFVLLSMANAQVLYTPARKRLATRLTLAFALAAIPLFAIVHLLRRSLRTFRQAEESAVRGERLRMLGEAVDLIAHEVRNSLNGVRIALDVILQSDRTGLQERQSRAVAGLRTEVERLADFTTELLYFSKGVVPRPAPLDLAQLVPQVAEVARDADPGVALEVARPPGGVMLRADPTLVHVVVANLLGNALAFAAAGDAAEPRVDVTVACTGACAEVRVADNGPGVAEGVRDRLFEPFVTGRPNGVGLGLALSRKIARAHGGDLVMETAGVGAVFVFTLPMDVA